MAKKLVIWLFLGIASLHYAHGQFNPDDIGGLEMWLRGDQGVLLNGNYVASWDDQSGNNHHATSPFDVIRPVLINDGLNGLPVVSFDGVDDFLSFTDVTNLRTAFWVLRESDQAVGWPPRPLLGYGGGVPFLRGPGEEFYDASGSASEVRNGTTRMNFTGINGTTTVMPTNYSIISLVTTGAVTVNTLTMELGIYGRTWWGEMAEVIIYNTALNAEEVLAVENYLAEKYGPQFIAMEDVNVANGFCDTTLCASPGFLNYQWENGPSTACYSVSSPGDYIVTLEDTFGRIIHDTVNVSFPGNLSTTNLTLCEGNSYLWDTGLNEVTYDFLWNDESTSSSLTISSAGEYSVTVTDNEGCNTTATLQVDVDTFSSDVSLGEDVALCSGNTIGLSPSNNEATNYTWNTESTSPTIIVTESGDYWVEALNANGCVERDTIHVDIIGVAPTITFNATGLCEDGTTFFTGENISSGTITSWQWIFGDGQEAEGQSVSHTYNASGDFVVQLFVTASSGCSNVYTNSIHIWQKPIAAYITDQNCNNQMTQFTDNSTSSEAAITGWAWMIDGEFFTGSEVVTTIETSGFNPIMLEVTDSNGCSTELNNFIEIKPAPIITFNVNGACQGVLTQFSETIDDSVTGGIVTYAWNFGDNTGSILPNPSHYYPVNGVYDVTLSATGVNGCSASGVLPVTIYSPPQADFDITNACEGVEFNFNNTSTINSGDPVVSWVWTIDGDFVSAEDEPSYVFNQTGLVPVTLQAFTSQGCSSNVAQQIPVWARPQAEFSYSPEIGEAPFEVQFFNETVGAAAAHWYFGDTQESDELNPTHVFTLNGTAYTQLVVYNDAGCADTVGRILTIAAPVYDIALQNISWEASGNAQELTATITNTGNIEIQTLLLSWQIGNDAPVMEEWNGNLAPGQTFNYVFSSHPQFAGSQFPYICVIAETSPITYQEINLTDNQICKPIGNTGLEVFPPYPNPGDDRMFIRFITPVEGDLEIRVLDVKGQLVMEINDTSVPKGFHQYFLDISALPDGHYKLLLEMESNKGVVSFMKIHK